MNNVIDFIGEVIFIKNSGILNFGGKNYWQKGRYDEIFKNSVNDYHECSSPNGEWRNIDKFFDQAQLTIKLYAK